MMATRTVRFDKETEQVLSEVRAATGLPISQVLKQGLRALQTHLRHTPVKTPYELYEALDLGPGGYAIGTSGDTRSGVRQAITRKLRR
jgi:hypothetical protein